MKTYRIALVPGDGIGKEVVPAGRRVLARFSHTVLRQGRLGRRRHLRGDFLRSKCLAAGMLGLIGVVLGCDGAFWASQGL